MIAAELLALLRCPENHSPLSEADAPLVTELNRLVATGRLRNVAGQVLGQRLDTALVREDRLRAYPVIDGIPVMLADQGIPLDQVHPARPT